MGKRSYTIIDSIKGGSGKTTLSIMLAIAAQHELDQSKAGSGKPIQTLLLDMDMQGSSLATMLFGDAVPGEDGLSEQYLDQRILYYYKGGSDEFISHPVLHLSSDMLDRQTVQISMALASPEMKDRLVFRASSSQNYASQITYTAFKAGLENVLQTMDQVCPDIPQYVLFDMPPNSNGYSDAVLDLLLHKKDGLCEKGDICNYFALTTLDRSHIDATIRWFKSFVTDRNDFPDHFFFTFNNVPGALSPMRPDAHLVDNSISDIRSKVSAILKDAPSDYMRRIYFVGVPYCTDYLRVCCSLNGLARLSSDLPGEMLTPVAFLVPFADSAAAAEASATKDLLDLMASDEEDGR